jgi:two-component system sensor histidine kinase PilS (NtrC family)
MLAAQADSLLGHSASIAFDIDPELLSGKALERSGGVTRAEGTARRATGIRFPVGYSTNPLLNADGTSTGSLVLFQDLSEITRLREVAAREERLAVLGRLSAGLAHEIRNPLGSISGAVQLVRDSPRLNEEENRLLGIILDEVERLDDLVATMLQVGRPHEPQCAREDLRPLLQAIVEMARRGPAAAKRVSIQSSLPDEPVPAWVDGHQVRQVLWNLIKNALQASPPGGVVRVAVKHASGGATLEVADEGEGISPSQRDKVYNMFYSERTHGAGIGLALVRQIVDAHRGTIEIRSEQRQGATFIVTFPHPPDANPLVSSSLSP